MTRVAPGGGAHRAGIRPGDLITGVDGRDIAAATPAQATEALSGAPGSTSVLTVDRLGQQLEIPVTRAPFYYPPLTSRMLPGSVGYIKLDSFVQNVAPLPDETRILDEFDRQLDDLEQMGARGLILDLRDNSGGYVTTGKRLVGRFVPEDTLTTISRNYRRPDLIGIAGGEMRRTQLPMVVLVNNGSASASETMASTLRENNRALLVGARTRGALSTAVLLPLPEGAGIQVSVAEVLTAGSRFKINTVGFPVDIEAADTRTLADFAAGRDPQIDAAVAALAGAPPPPAFKSIPTAMTSDELRTIFSRYMPAPLSMPTNERLSRANFGGSQTITHVNNVIGATRDPLARQADLRRRGYMGGFYQLYSVDLLVQPLLTVSFDLFATPEGASEEMSTIESPETTEAIPNPIGLGEETFTVRGIASNAGELSIAWRYGNLVIGVSYGDVPGLENVETVVPAARLVDALYRQNPLQQGKPAASKATSLLRMAE